MALFLFKFSCSLYVFILSFRLLKFLYNHCVSLLAAMCFTLIIIEFNAFSNSLSCILLNILFRSVSYSHQILLISLLAQE